MTSTVRRMIDAHPGAVPGLDAGLLTACPEACAECAQVCALCADVCSATAAVPARSGAHESGVLRAQVVACAGCG